MVSRKTPLLILVFAAMLVTGAVIWPQASEDSKGGEALVACSDASEAKFVGVAACRCHMKEDLGNQYRSWIGSKHMRSYVMLAGPYGRTIMENMGVSGYAQETEICFTCHAPRPDTSCAEQTFRFEEGIQCETCHGPGSLHVAKMMTMGGEKPLESGFRKLSKDDCMRCHAPKASHEDLPTHLRSFDLDKAWKKIAHPIAE